MQPLHAIIGKSKTMSRTSGRCSIHGDFVTMTRNGLEPACPVCVGERAKADAQRDYLASLKPALLRDAHIPQRFDQARFKNYRAECEAQRDAIIKLQRFIAEFREHTKTGAGVLMVGAPGTGKTHLACATARAVIGNHGASCRYTSATAMLAEIRRAYDEQGMSVASQVSRFVTPALLVLDELDRHACRDNDIDLLFQVVDARYQACRPTIAISNSDIEPLQQRLSLPLVSRLIDGTTIIVCDWESARRPA